jgi:nitrogen PTS system EIIA component
MQLTVRDAAALLNLPEKEIYRLIKRNEIPNCHINKSWFFNKAELLEWAISRSVDIAPEFFTSSEINMERLPLLSEALKKGGIHRISEGNSKVDVLQKIVTLIPEIDESEKPMIFKALLARETLGTTAIGNGIAIPHVRNPIILNLKGPSVLLCFLEKPVDFGALDGTNVSTIFTMNSPTARIHLHLLARLSFLLQNNELRNMLSPDHEPALVFSKIQDEEKRINAIPDEKH